MDHQQQQQRGGEPCWAGNGLNSGARGRAAEGRQPQGLFWGSKGGAVQQGKGSRGVGACSRGQNSRRAQQQEGEVQGVLRDCSSGESAACGRAAEGRTAAEGSAAGWEVHGMQGGCSTGSVCVQGGVQQFQGPAHPLTASSTPLTHSLNHSHPLSLPPPPRAPAAPPAAAARGRGARRSAGLPRCARTTTT